MPPRSHEGQTLSWTARGDVLEVTLHREPANEIGLTTLGELETLATHVRDGADGAIKVMVTL